MLNTTTSTTNRRTAFPFSLGWIGWLAVLAVVFMGISILLRLLTPPTPAITISPAADGRQNMDGSASIFNNVVYQGPEIVVPKKLPLMKVELSDQAATKIVADIVSYYKLQPHSTLPETWSNPNFILYKNTNNQEYLFTIKNGEIKNPHLSLLDAQETVNKLLQTYPELANLSFIPNRVKYLQLGGKGGADGDETEPNKADTISLEYSWKIQDVPVFLPKRFEGNFVAIINADLVPVRLSFPLNVPTIGEQISQNSVLTLPQAVEQLNRSIGSVIYAEQTDVAPFDVSKISSAQLNSVSLEYRIDPELKVAIPYYRFSGVIQNVAGSIYTAQLLTPAVATTPSN